MATNPLFGRPMLNSGFRGNFNAGTSNAEGYTPGRGLSVTEIYRQRENRPGAYSPATGQAVPRGTQLFTSGWNTSGVGPGSKGYRGSGRIGSAAGAVGSSGIPTSQRGRAEKYGIDPMTGGGAWQDPSWMVGQGQRDQFGMSPDWAYGGMGQLPYNSASPVGSTPGSSPKPADSSTSTKPNPWGDRTTFGNQPASRFAGPAASTIGGMLGIPGSFFGTSVMDMLNRQRLW